MFLLGSILMFWLSYFSSVYANGNYSYKECLKQCDIDPNAFSSTQFIINRESVIDAIECSKCANKCDPDDEFCISECFSFEECPPPSDFRVVNIYTGCLQFYKVNLSKLTPLQYVYDPEIPAVAKCVKCINCEDDGCFTGDDWSFNCRESCVNDGSCETVF